MNRIPKIFFQTSRTKLDANIIDMIQYNLTDEWEYIHYTDDDIFDFFNKYPVEEFSDISEKFKSIKPEKFKILG